MSQSSKTTENLAKTCINQSKNQIPWKSNRGLPHHLPQLYELAVSADFDNVIQEMQKSDAIEHAPSLSHTTN